VLWTATLFTTLLSGSALMAQGPEPEAPKPASGAANSLVADSRAGAPVEAAPFVGISGAKPASEYPHKFLDKWNVGLFTGAAALDAADFALTRSNLQSHGKELNPVVRVFGRSSAGLAVNFGGEALGTVGLSYFFHKTRHYKLERAVSLVNIGASAGAVSYSSTHR
jgi:hypothetical protein